MNNKALKILGLSSLLFLSACESELTIFVPQTKGLTQFDGLKSVAINLDGHFELTWDPARSTRPQSYEIYLLKTAAPPVDNLSLFQDENDLIDTAAVLDTDTDRPSKVGKLVGKVGLQTSFILSDEIIDPDMYYSFEVKVSPPTPQLRRPSSVLVSKVNFKEVSSSESSVSNDRFNLSWTPVPGATSYQIFEGINSTKVVYTTETPSIALSFLQASVNREYCVRALRGTLRSKSCLPLQGVGPTWQPRIVELRSPQGAGLYQAGDKLQFEVEFSDNVTVDSATGLRLPIYLDASTKRYANYVRGEGNDTLTFAYSVENGDNSQSITIGEALESPVSGGVIDAEGRKAVLDLSLTDRSLGKVIGLDTTAPSNPASVGFASATSNSSSIGFGWIDGADLNFLHYRSMLCEASDCLESCSSVVTSELPSVSIPAENGKSYFACVQSVDKVGLSSAWVSSIQSLRVDRTSPTILRVTSPLPDGFYTLGASIPIRVDFTETVWVLNPEDVGMMIKFAGSTKLIPYASGSGTTSLTFTYTVAAGETSTDLDYNSTGSILIGGQGSIRDSAGNNALLNLAIPGTAQSLAGSKALVIDTTSPMPPTGASFGATHSTQTNLSLGWSPGTDTNFKEYRVKLCTDSSCTTSCTSEATTLLTTQGLTGADGDQYYGCVRGEDHAGLSSSWAASSPIHVDVTPPTISNVTTSKADGSYTTGESLTFHVRFSEPIIVTDSASVALGLSLAGRHATFAGNSGLDTLNFTYTLQNGDNSSDLDYADPNALTLGGMATIKDSAGNVANLTLPPLGPLSLAGASQIIVDTTPPTDPASIAVTSSTSNPTNFGLDWTASVEANFDHYKVKLCPDATCSVSCLPTHQVEELSASLVGVAGQTYYGCVQAADTVGQMSNWIASSGSILQDDIAPTILQVTSSKANGAYGIGVIVPVKVKFSESVFVTNEYDLTLTVETGVDDRILTYASGSGTDTFTFNYSVQAGDISSDLDILSANALTLGTGVTIQDAAGNAAITSLPAPGSSESLAGQKNIIIDTTPPTAPASPGFGSASNTTASFDLSWNDSSDLNLKHHNVKLCSASDCSTCLSVVTASASPAALLAVPDGTYYGCVQGEDLASQTSAWASTLNPIVVDATEPTVTNMSTPLPSGALKGGDVITINVTFSEPVIVSNSSNLSLALETGPTDHSAEFLSSTGNIVSFSYTVLAGDTTSALDIKDPSSLLLGMSGAIRDAAGNVADLTLASPGSAGSLSFAKSIILDTTVPTPSFTSPAALTAGAGSLAISLSCETNNLITITGGILSPISNLTCMGGSLSRTLYLSSGEGNKTIHVSEADAAGNIGTTSRIFVNDNLAPALTQNTALSTNYTNLNTLTVGGSCETGFPVIISIGGVEDGRYTCASSAWTYTTTSKTTDATRIYTITQTDTVGNHSSLTVTWIRDTSTPGFLFDNLSHTYTTTANADSVTFRGSCDSSSSVANPSISITGTGISGTASANCTLGTWSYLAPAQTSNGLYIYSFVQSDIAGNTSTINGSWTRNATGPVLTADMTLLKSKSNQATFTGSCDSTYVIDVSGPGTPAAPSCVSGSWSFTTPAVGSDGSTDYVLTQTSNLGYSTNISLTFIRDTSPPVVSDLRINNGDTETLAYRVRTSFSALDSLTPVTAVCLLQRSWIDPATAPSPPSEPLASDGCWQSFSTLGLTAAKSMGVSDLTFILDLAAAKYSIYAYVKDEVGNISSLSNVEGDDRATITLALPIPPTLTIREITDANGSPDDNFNAGDEVDIHWKISGGSGLGATPVSIRYSLDDNTWMNLANDLSDTSHGCALFGDSSGCLRLSAPTHGYFRLQLVVKNEAGNQFFLETKPLNTAGRVRAVAGRTFKGINGTARAFQLSYLNMDTTRPASNHNFVVTRQGVIYVIDTALGILKIDPKDQIVRVAYPKSTYPGDGPIGANMAFQTPDRIWLDQKQPLQRLFIAEANHLRILDFNSNTSRTINSTTGSGISPATSSTVEFFPTQQGIFTKTNGNISGAWFAIPAYLNEASGKFDFFRLNTSAVPYYNTTANTLCEGFPQRSFPIFNADGSLWRWAGVNNANITSTYYNCRGAHVYSIQFPAMTGVYLGQQGGGGDLPAEMPSPHGTHGDVVTIGGLNGKVYALMRQGNPNAGLLEYDSTLNTWTKVVGLTAATQAYQTSCPDGTLVSLCDVDLNSAFVDEGGKIYFMDQGQIRLVDANQKVQTIFGTSFKKIEDNLTATDTVLGPFLHYFQRRMTSSNEEEVVFSHHASISFRSVMNGRISVLAGNGVDWSGAVGGPANGSAPGIREGWTLAQSLPFGMDESGNLYTGDYGASSSSQHSTVFKLDRSTMNWSTLIPYTCTNCTAIFNDAFDITAPANVYAPATAVQLYSVRTGIASPNTLGTTRSAMKPQVFGYQNGKISFHSMDVPFNYTGSTMPYTTGFSYLLNSGITTADVSETSGLPVTNVTRRVGSKGVALLTGRLNPDTKYGTGYLSALPSEGTAANAFDVPVPYWNGGLSAIVRSFQEYEGAHYMAYQYNLAPAKIWKITPAAVTTHVTTSANISSFKLLKSGSDDILYYCATTGELLKRNLTSPTTPAEIQLDLVIPGATCSGSTLHAYSQNGQDYLMLVYSQNALNGIMELKVSP